MYLSTYKIKSSTLSLVSQLKAPYLRQFVNKFTLLALINAATGLPRHLCRAGYDLGVVEYISQGGRIVGLNNFLSCSMTSQLD